MVLQVEDLREAGAGEWLFVPAAVLALACRSSHAMPARASGLSASPAAIRPSSAQAVCDAVGSPMPASVGSS